MEVTSLPTLRRRRRIEALTRGRMGVLMILNAKRTYWILVLVVKLKGHL